jgi:hypothetical protein
MIKIFFGLFLLQFQAKKLTEYPTFKIFQETVDKPLKVLLNFLRAGYSRGYIIIINKTGYIWE